VRGIFAGLVIGFIITVISLFISAVGAVGISLIGLLLSSWFELSQWQGSLIALVIALGVGAAIYRMTVAPSSEPEWMALDEVDEPAEVGAGDPPIVPWRRQRPTQGDPPSRSQPKPPEGSSRK
jgi:hypothetical protein